MITKTQLENIILRFGNRLLSIGKTDDDPTLGELIDTPVNEIKELLERAIEEAKPSILYGDEHADGWSDSAERYESNLKDLLK